MRESLSDLIVQHALADPKVMVLSGDHGYALFDAIQREAPAQFINVGVCEQGMVGYAAGMASIGMRPIIYGLASFVPLRVLEQVKLDLCYPSLPVLMLGDGAGVVYSSLGSSHQCAEDVAALQAMPNLKIFSPCDEHELRHCFAAAWAHPGPSYIRIGKSDRPVAHSAGSQASAAPHWVQQAPGSKACLVATGSMVSLCQSLGQELGASVISVPTLKPLDPALADMLKPFSIVISAEEHSRHGGLASALGELLIQTRPQPFPRVEALALKEQFAAKAGSYQYALSEHDLDDVQVGRRVRQILDGNDAQR
jgi:transketolase